MPDWPKRREALSRHNYGFRLVILSTPVGEALHGVVMGH